MSALTGGPGVLLGLINNTYRRLWQANFKRSVEALTAQDVVNTLNRVAGMYDATSLVTELNAQPAMRAEVCAAKTAGVQGVPELRVRTATDETQLDDYLQHFLVFLSQPSPKRFARAAFVNTNPLVLDDDIRQVVMFYRGDDETFVFAVERKSGEHEPDVFCPNVTIPELTSVRSWAELIS